MMMCPVPARPSVAPQKWSNLVTYYRGCLKHEQMQRLQISIEKRGFALLRDLKDQLITKGKAQTVLSDPMHLQQIRQFLARKHKEENLILYYGCPVVIEQKNLIPVAYVEISVEPGLEPGTVVLRRQGELLLNRRFLMDGRDLTEAEVAEFARRLGAQGPGAPFLQDLLGDGAVASDALLFRADPDIVTRSLLYELDRLKEQTKLSPALAAFIADDPPVPALAATPGVTVVRSNPAQDQVLRQRHTVMQVVSGPPGTGKTQTIINLIASAICDGQTVLFISKNNTAVDNVYDAFLEQKLFPGVLRLGSQEVRARSLDYFRQVLANLDDAPFTSTDPEAFLAEGLSLNREIGCLEEELGEVQRLQTLEKEMATLLGRTEEALKESGLYRYATDLSQQITATNAGDFHPQHLVGLRRLTARAVAWQESPRTLWTRVLDRLGVLNPLRFNRLHKELRELRLSACCAIHGKDLPQQLEALLRLTVVFPFLLATARLLLAKADLAAKRSAAEIRSDLDRAYAAKIRYDKQRLRRQWAELVRKARPKAAQLAELVPLFERMAGGTANDETRREWRRRYDDLLTIFPVICCTNLSLASAAPREPERFDLVILDEASQSDIPSLLPALYRARRACVVGDEKQLSHISGLGAEADDRLMATAGLRLAERLSYHRHSAFDRALAVAGRTAFTLLDRHYRCVPEIITFCNEEFYDEQLKVERVSEPGGAPAGGLPTRGFLLDEMSAGSTEYRSAAARKSALNAREAERVISLVRQYIAAGLTDIGVVTPFRAQRELLNQLRNDAMRAEPEPSVRAALNAVEIGTIHTFQGGQHRLMLFSTVVAPGAREGTIRWFEENRNLLNVAISRARDLLVVVCHRFTLEQAGGILGAMVTYADGLARAASALPPLPPGLQPERLGLLPNEEAILREWLNPPGAVAEVMNPGEQVLYRELQARVGERRVLLAPKMRVLDSLEPAKMPGLTQQERDYAFRAHFDIVLVDLDSFKPIAAVELDGAHHQTDPLTQARDRLKNSLCEKAGLPLIRVRWRDWGALEALEGVLEAASQ